MPYKIRKLPNQNYYQVKQTTDNKIVAKKTTLANAKKQVSLLNRIGNYK